MDIEGVIPALTTPFDADGRVDEEGLAGNVEFMLEAGIHSFVTSGTMGEASALTGEERRGITRRVVELAADGRVIAGISGTCAAEAIAYAGEAAEDGADAVMCLPPTTYNGDRGEVLDFFGEVVRATDLPLIVYNNPGASKSELPVALIAEIAALEGVVAVKESSGDARRYAALASECPDGFAVLVGGDDCALEGYAAGATGWISGVANAVPAICLELEDCCRGNDLARGRELWAALLPLARLDMDPKLVQYFKGALDRLGLVGGPSRPPRAELRTHEVELLDAAIDQLRAANLLTVRDGQPQS